MSVYSKEGTTYPAPKNEVLRPLSIDQVNKWRKDFYSNSQNVLAQNIITEKGIKPSIVSRKVIEEKKDQVFTHDIPQVEPVTNQFTFGACWMYSAFNCMRIPFVAAMKLPSFEFSQNHGMYWTTQEKSIWYLNNVVYGIKQGGPGPIEDSRFLGSIMGSPIYDGSYYATFINTITKYGCMPSSCFPKSANMIKSEDLNFFVNSKLKEYTKTLVDMHKSGKSECDLYNKVVEIMGDIYKIVGILFGVPSETFTWEYYDITGKYNSIGPITPKEFYEKLVKPVFNVENLIQLSHRPNKPMNVTLEVNCNQNCEKGEFLYFINLPLDVIMELTTASLVKGIPVPFNCDISKNMDVPSGILDLDILNYKAVFGEDFHTTISKSDRVRWNDNIGLHAMLFTGVSIDESGKPTKFKVENSWGRAPGGTGCFVMYPEWFKEHVFDVAIQKDMIPKNIMDIYEKDHVKMDIWELSSFIK